MKEKSWFLFKLIAGYIFIFTFFYSCSIEENRKKITSGEIDSIITNNYAPEAVALARCNYDEMYNISNIVHTRCNKITFFLNVKRFLENVNTENSLWKFVTEEQMLKTFRKNGLVAEYDTTRGIYESLAFYSLYPNKNTSFSLDKSLDILDRASPEFLMSLYNTRNITHPNGLRLGKPRSEGSPVDYRLLEEVIEHSINENE